MMRLASALTTLTLATLTLAPASPSVADGARVPARAVGLLHDCGAAPTGPQVALRTEYRPTVNQPREPGPSAIAAVILTSQCAELAASGAYVPAGLRAELYGPCPATPCLMGITVLTEGFTPGTFLGTLRDGVGFREITVGENRKAELVLRVKTKSEAKGPATSADYLLLADPADPADPGALAVATAPVDPI